ncbi:MAG: carbon storage regulator [Lysobacterales bacterium]|nr:MAG: carbon storage regulator [Xanthomonadales bacterium]
MSGLILARKIGEKIIIGDDIVITIVRGDSFHLALMIEAPPEIRVDRMEIREKRNKGDVT